MTLPMSFSDAVNKEMVVVEAEKAREGDTPCAQTTTASQPRGMEDVDEEEEKVELRMPGSFGFGDRGSGVACEAGYRRSVWCCWYAPEFVAVDAAEMRAQTRTPFSSNFIRFNFRFCGC